MSKKIIGMLLALCLVVGLLPAITAQYAHAEETDEETDTGATSATVKLWGIDFTVDIDDATADIPAARYWTNNTSRDTAPAESDASNWNYSFTIVDGVPTVTLRNANYYYGGKISAFLKATLEGSDKLEVKYEGENTFTLSTGTTTEKHTTAQLFNISTKSADVNFNITGAKDAVLTLTTAYNLYMINVPYATLTIKGGTLNYTRGSVGHNGFINSTNGRLNIEDCTINCTSIKEGTSTYPVIVGGSKTTIDNSKINIDTVGCGIMGGYFNSAYKAADHEKYARNVTITNSEVTINAQSTGTKVYSGSGIFARGLTIQGSTVEITASRAALAAGGTTTTVVVGLAPEFLGGYTMYTEKDGAAVTKYTTTTYFKTVATGASAPTTEPTTAPTTEPTTAPTTAPTTTPTQAPTTKPTTAPTTAPTKAPTTAPTQGDTAEAGNNDVVIAVVIVAVVAVLAVAAVVIIKKKQAAA